MIISSKVVLMHSKVITESFVDPYQSRLKDTNKIKCTLNKLSLGNPLVHYIFRVYF